MDRGPRIFEDRTAAGVALARAVKERFAGEDVLVLGLPRGGVPVAYEVAKALGAPLDVMIVRKVGMPGQPELAIGAVASGGIAVREVGAGPLLGGFGPSFETLAERERTELARREKVYRGSAPPVALTGRTVILVDDGLATGATMVAAIRAARKAGAARVVVAAPVASTEAANRMREEADDVVILQTPAFLFSIGEWYHEFDQLEDSEVCELLERSRATAPNGNRTASGTAG